VQNSDVNHSPAERDRLIAALNGLPDEPLPDRLAGEIRQLRPAELADIIESCKPPIRPWLWRAADDQQRGESLTEVHGDVREQIIAAAEPDELISGLRHLQMDELADLEHDVPDDVFARLLDTLTAEERARFDMLRRHPSDSAGGLMDVDAPAVPAEVNLAGVQRYLRDIRERDGMLPEHLDSVFVVDKAQCYLGRLPLADVLTLPAETTVEAALKTDIEAIPADTPADDVARRFEDQDLLSAPVVDAEGRLLGRITVDDVIDVIRGEGENAVLGRAGLDKDVDPFGSIASAVKRRTLWIGIHLVNALIAASVIGLFQESIERLVALAVLMPIVAGVGGVGGTQSLTIVTRGIALNQVGPANAPRLFTVELAVSIINGLIWASLLAVVVFFWFDNLGLAAVLACALLFNLMNGALVGTGLPLLLDRVGIDPAIAGGVLLVAATDILGFLIFLGLASALLL
jgi:magnesium transporter